MQLQVHGLNLHATESLHDYIERRFHFALGRVAHTVRAVVLRLKDVNGAKGGINKRCHVVIEMTSGEQLVLNDVDEDVYESVDRLAGRTKTVVRRHLARRKDRTRRRRRSRRPW